MGRNGLAFVLDWPSEGMRLTTSSPICGNLDLIYSNRGPVRCIEHHDLMLHNSQESNIYTCPAAAERPTVRLCVDAMFRPYHELSAYGKPRSPIGL